MAIAMTLQTMQNRPFIVSTLTLVGGLMLSLVALYLGIQLCNSIQETRLYELGTEQTQAVADEMRATVRKVESLAEQLEREPDLDSERFANLAAPFLRKHGFHSAEWLPFIPPSERASVELAMSAELGEARQIVGYRNGRTVAPDASKSVRPIRFVYPFNEQTAPLLGLQRSGPASRKALQREGAFLTDCRRWYKLEVARYGVFCRVASSVPDDKYGLLFVTLCDMGCNSSLNSADMTVDIKDLTALDTGELKSMDCAATVVSSDSHSYVADAVVGGRHFLLTATEKERAGFRPAMLPWLLFLGCNLGAAGICMMVYKRESVSLRAQYHDLQLENERRMSIQRQLQGMLDFREQERELIAHDIHDGFVQDVIGAQMYAESITASLPVESAERANVQLISEVLAKAIEDARQTIDYLKPRVVDEVGLVSALEVAVNDDQKQYNFGTDFSANPDFPRLPLLAERMLFRMAREAICNARQHSGADSVQVNLQSDDERIKIVVQDNGCGFDMSTVDQDSFGVVGMQHRAEVLNGTVNFDSSSDGTIVEIEIPRKQNFPEKPVKHSLSLMP